MAARGRYFNRQGSTGNQNHGSPLPMSGPNNYGSHRNNDNNSPRPSSGSSYSSMNDPTRGPRPNQPVCIGEEVKIGIHLAFERFRLNPEQKELEFPSSLTATERAYIHRLCEDYNLKSKSHGKGASRCLTIYKKEGNQSSGTSVTFQLARNSRHQILSLMQRFPLTNKERQELQPKTHKSTVNEIIKDLNCKTTTGRLNNGVPQIPPQRGSSDLNSFRESLPIQEYQEDIIHTINHNQVVLVSSETGSGKTTQVPQMILDDCFANSKPCRIFCTQPRRIAALSIAERVAAERGEKIGQTVGYQIRLESKVSPKTLLTFCTNGVLLRTLMGGDSSLTAVTHILVDEVHERDRFSDFLLIVLRDALVKYKNLRLVLMSATLNTDLFLQYFNRCPIALIPGTLFDVQEFFLEDVLKWTEYSNKKMLKFKKEQYKVEKQQEQLSEWCHQEMINDDKPSTTSETDSAIDINTNTYIDDQQLELGQECDELEDWVVQEMDRLLGELWLTGNEDLFSQVFHLILSENVSVDYKHSETSVTPLMIASGRGFSNIVEKLLSLGANINIKASNEWTALDWSKKFEQNDIVDMLEGHLSTLELGADESVNQKNDDTISTEDRELLKTYQHSFDDEKVDIDLLSILLYKIHTSQPEGAVLVFLPGYDDIVALRDKVSEDKKFEQSRYVLYVLHSSIQSSDQKRVFKQPPSGVRKIILSTNIAETSITINDVVYVVDCGKVKEKTFDALSGITMLKSNWISKASSQQRKGRAGRCRPGICYHMFSRIRYSNLMEYQQPEILRFPLQELCLNTKLLAPANCEIADFLAKAPEPPAFLVVQNSIQILKQIDALDPFEDLTELGHHLTDLPIEPRLGKMVLFSVVLKCLDPVLTIVCSIAYKDPFVLPAQPYQKRASAMARRKFASDTFSDHMALLRAFQAWQKARTEGWERGFCEKNFLSSACMEMIVGMRTQLLGQLRASGFVRARGGGDIRDLNTNSENWAVVKAALCAGMYPNVIRVDRKKRCLVTQKEGKVRFHSSSVLSPAPTAASLSMSNQAETIKTLPSDWLIYEEMTRLQKMASVRCCTLVSPIAVALFGGSAKLSESAVREAEGYDEVVMNDIHHDSSESESEDKEDCKKSTLNIDDWISFRIDKEACKLALQLRQKWNTLLLRRMRSPSKPWSPMDECIIRAVINVLTNEEQAIGLQQPAGIGQRPRPMSAETMMTSGGGGRGGGHTSYDEFDRYGGRNNRLTKTPTNTPPRRNQNFKSPSSKSLDGSEGSNSSNTSGTNSLRGSKNNTPCASPQPHTTSKWSDHGSSTNRYFIMKCNNQKNLDISLSRGIWATTAANNKTINKSFMEGKTVYLIFSIQGSGHFQGYARMIGESSKDKSTDFSLQGLSGNFPIEWIKRSNIPFSSAHNLVNPWNDGKKVQISRDGQEIEPKVGESLLKLWDQKHSSPSSKQTVKSSQSESSTSKSKSSSPNFSSGYQGNTNDNNSQGHYQSHGHHRQGNQHGHSGMNVYSQGMNLSAMNASFNSMYVNPHINQSSGGMMMSSSNASPRPGMSPVMILQRGSSSPGQGHPNFSNNPRGYGGGLPGSYHHGNQK